MWTLNNRTPYAVERNWTRDKHGAHLWLVALQATFDIGPAGKLRLADEQPPPCLVPAYRGDPTTTSLRRDSDLLAPKLGTDVLLDACAYAPGERPARKVPVSLRVATIEKTLVVYGPRAYHVGLLGVATSSPHPFLKQPIHYECAFGGSDLGHSDPRQRRIDARNPVGKGVAASHASLHHQVAHAVEYPHGDPAKVGPAGFGPLSGTWSPRLERAGTFDAHWERTKKPLLPDDYDDRFAMASPDDQRADKPLRGGEVMTLINMTPDGEIRFELPKLFFAFRTKFGRRGQEHRALLTTVFVALEERKLQLVWQTALRVAPRDLDYLDETIVREKSYLV